MTTIFTTIVVAALLAAVAQAGYVDLYRDADFKHKNSRGWTMWSWTSVTVSLAII
ncbi:hypothetical protein PC121_g5438 [Phytophthora cactorum]|nr:hypothetical protein PC121_g5438 [Phytophthora cactorum]